MKKKIASVILSLSLVFNIPLTGVYAEGTDVVDGSDVVEVTGDVTGEVTIGDTINLTGLVSFPEGTFSSNVQDGDKVGEIQFSTTDGNVAGTSALTFQSEHGTAFIDGVSVEVGTEYIVTLINADDSDVADYSIPNVTPVDGDSNGVSLIATTIGDGMVVISGFVDFPDNTFDMSNLSGSDKIGQIKFERKSDKGGVKEVDLKVFDHKGATFEVSLEEEVEYTVTIIHTTDYTTGYSINDNFITGDEDNSNAKLTATKDSSSQKVTVSGTLTFVEATAEDLENTKIQLQFSADGNETVVADLTIKETNVGYFENIELVDGVTYALTVLGIDSYTIADYNPNFTVDSSDLTFVRFATKVDGYANSVISLTGIVTFPDADFDQETFTEDAKIIFTPTKGGLTRTSKLEYKGPTTLNYYFNDILENKEYTVTISGVDDYTLNEKYTTPAKDDSLTKDFKAAAVIISEDGKELVEVTPEPATGDDKTYGSTNTKIESWVSGDFSPTLKPISTAGEDVITSKTIEKEIKDTVNTTSETKNGVTTETTVKYSAPEVMFDLSLENDNTDVTVKVQFDPITLTGKNDSLYLFHFDEDGTRDKKPLNATFGKDENGKFNSVTFTTDDFSPFAIAQGYSTVKITQTNSSTAPSSSSSSSSSGSVSAVGSDGTQYYITGNIPTIGFISQLRGVSVGEMVNLDKITVSGKEIIGWYYDSDFTKEVKDTATFVITQDVMDNGVFPKFEMSVGVLAADLFLNNDYSVNTSYTANNYVSSNVPSTGVAFGARLF